MNSNQRLNKGESRSATGQRVMNLPPLAAPSTSCLVLASHLFGEGDERHHKGHEHKRCTGPLHCQSRVIRHMETAGTTQTNGSTPVTRLRPLLSDRRQASQKKYLTAEDMHSGGPAGRGAEGWRGGRKILNKFPPPRNQPNLPENYRYVILYWY